MLLAVAITSTIHFAQLTVLRRLDPAARAALAPIAAIPWRWPSLAYGLGLFAWDACFGLALLFTPPRAPPPWRGPSPAYGLALSVWAACFGLALLFPPRVFPGAGREAAIRRTLR